MQHSISPLSSSLVVLAALFLVANSAETDAGPAQPARTSYDELVTLFAEWREFEEPTLVDGVPDYSAANMATMFPYDLLILRPSVPGTTATSSAM